MYTNLVFAGGGNRCFWQAGFWEVFSANVEMNPLKVSSVSAGSAISCAIFADRIIETLEATIEIQSQNKKNRYWSRALKGKNIHPHAELYRKIVYKGIDNESLQKLQSGPTNRVLLAELPPLLGPRSSVAIGLLSYQLEKKLFHPVHPKFGARLGFRSRFVAANNCTTVEELCDLILSSSCTPPFTPIMKHRGDPVLDGGMVDNVPLHGIKQGSGKTLVMLSRPYAKLPSTKGTDYVAPRSTVSVSSWDYTSPNLVLATYEQGKRDALQYLKEMRL